MTVIIPVYKDARGLEDTLQSLQKQKVTGHAYEVIVCNDGHDLKITRICQKYNAKEVYTRQNKGSYMARNMALAESKGEFISFTDADIKVPENWLEDVCTLFYTGFDYIGGPVTIDTSKIKTLTNEFVSFYEFDNEAVFRKSHFSPTANVHVRRKVIDELGGFDRRMFSSGDMEFGDRVYHSKKFKQTYSKDITVIHPPRSYKAFIKKLARISGGEVELARLYPDRFQPFNKSIYRELREALYFPKLPVTLSTGKKIQLTLLGIWFQIFRAFHNISNRNKSYDKYRKSYIPGS